MNAIKLSACLILCAASAGVFAAPASMRGTQEWVSQKVVAEDGVAGDVFGFSAAMHGDVAMVGAAQGAASPTGNNGGNGRVYVYNRVGLDWSVVQKLNANDGAEDDQFGYAVAFDGDTALVSAAFADVNEQQNQGAVYVFTYSAETGWTQTQKLIAADGEAGDQFGWSVAIDGDRAIVGSRGASISDNQAQGAAYVFTHQNGAWTQQAKLTDSLGTVNDQFGYSVAIHGATVLVSAPNANGAMGNATFYTEAAGTWTQGSTIDADDGASNENFGYTLTFDGTTALVGSPFAAVNGALFQGAVYAFADGGKGWVQTQKIVADDGQFFDAFGISVAIDGNEAVITAPFFNASQGSAYRFTRGDDGTWTQAEKHVADDAVQGEGAAYGYVAAISQGSFVIGQALAKQGDNTYQGAAYFYAPERGDSIFADGFEPAN